MDKTIWVLYLLFLFLTLLGPMSAQPQEILLQDMTPEVKDALMRVRGDLGIDFTRDFQDQVEVIKLNPDNYDELKRMLEPFPEVHVTTLEGDYRALLHQVDTSRVREDLSSAQNKLFDTISNSETAETVELLELAPEALSTKALTMGFGQKDGFASENTLLLPLSGNQTVEVVRESLCLTDGCFVWRGRPADGKGSVVLMVNGESVRGLAFLDKTLYSIKPLGSGMHALIKRDTKRFVPDHPPMADPNSSNLDIPVGEPLGSDETADVDILFAYTKEAAAKNNSIHNDVIGPALNLANTSLRDSGLRNVNLRVAAVVETDYKESYDWDNHLRHLQDPSDGVMDELHELRDEYKADIVILVIADDTYGGEIAKVLPGHKQAFAVVNELYAVETLTLAHELGHFFGAGHNSGGLFGYGHSYHHSDNLFRTIMSYEDDNCRGCTRVPRWSGPQVNWFGIPCGDDSVSNNLSLIKKYAKRVSRFR